MPDMQRLKKRATELEQKRQFDKALEVYIQLLDEAGRDLPDQDVPLFNRVGDMLIRKGDTSGALAYYERAVDAYAERGFLNNAIALCNKILRQSPGRTAVYYKLGKISARKGFKSDARKAFLEYADRMQKVGHLDEAFRALKEFASLYPDQDDVRLILADLLSRENRKGEALEQLQALYEKLESEGREVEARATVDRMKAIDPNVTPRTSGTAPAPVASDLVFLDLTTEAPTRRTTPRSSAAATQTAAPDAQERHGAPAGLHGAVVPALDGLALAFVPEDDPVDTPARLPDLEPTSVEATTHVATPTSTPSAGTALQDVGEVELIDLETPEADLAAATPHESVLLDGFEATALSVADDHPVESEASVTQPSDDGLLSESEFAELELADTAPPVPTRAHDLALPTGLPLLVFEATPAESPAVPAEQSAEATVDLNVAGGDEEVAPGAIADTPVEGADSSGGRETPVAGEVTSARTRTPARHATLASRASDDADHPPSTDQAGADSPGVLVPEDEPRAAVPAALSSSASEEPHRAAAEDEEPLGWPEEVAEWIAGPALPAPGGDAEGTTAPGAQPEVTGGVAGDVLDDFLAEPPSFGDPKTSGAHAFPPLPGFSEALGTAAMPEATDGEPPDAVGPDRNAALGPRDAEAIAASGTTEQSDTGLLESPVDAPLPIGFGDDSAEERGATQDSGTTTPHRGSAGEKTPRLVVSIGGAEAQLRRRLELEPEDWGIRRQLGEVLLDAGDRDAGLYELELSMAGWELSGEPDRALEILDVILRVMPGSVRHHQKRVEFAVRANDHLRLVEAYLELADALFRTGEAEKASDVYRRVVELDPGNERAEFALATLPGTEGLEAQAGAPRPRRFSDEMDVVDTGAPLPPTPTEPQRVVTAPQTAIAEPLVTPRETPVVPVESLVVDVIGHEASTTRLDAHENEASSSDGVSEPVAPEEAPVPASGDVRAGDGREAAPHMVVEPETEELDVGGAAPSPTSDPRESLLDRARRLTPAAGSEADFVDLGEWLRLSEPAKNTRMVVDETAPTGDEQADFEEMLRRFKRGVAESVDVEDFEAHYDLGVAYKEMGLVDEAIAEFQKALRGSEHRVRAYEALGQCFVEKGQYSIAAALLQRGVDTPGPDDDVLVGVLYLLGFASEQMGRHGDALRYYQRVFAVDIEFRDVAQRVAALELPTK